MNNNPVNYVDPWGLAGLACDKGQLLDRLEYNRRGVENLPNFLGNCIVQLANSVKAAVCYSADVASNPSRVVDDMKNVAKGTVYLAQNPQILGGAVQNIQTYESLPSLFVGGGLLKGGKIGRFAKGGSVGNVARKTIRKSKQSTSSSFFKNTRYSNEAIKKMRKGNFHGFPEEVSFFEKHGKVTKIRGGDGVLRQKLEIPGSYKGNANWKEGVFEFIKEKDGLITHRFFNPKK